MGFSMNIEDYDKLGKDVKNETRLDELEKAKMKDMAKQNIDKLSHISVDTIKEKYMVAKEIEAFGIDTLRTSSQQNHLLQKSINQVSGEGSNGKEVMDGIESLKVQMEFLNPEKLEQKRHGILTKLWGQTTTYFDKYRKVDAVIEKIIDSLEEGKQKLQDDNSALEIEAVSLRELTKRLSKEIELAVEMDKQLAAEISNMKQRQEDTLDIEFVEQEVLFPLRQRIIDLEQMLIVNRQGIISIEVIRRNNNELTRAVDRARYVTVSALRIATMVAAALYDQKVVVNNINNLNVSTAEFIEATSRMLKNQSIEISRQSSQSTISVDTLKLAYQEAMEALEVMNKYKLEALPKMKEVILEFEKLNYKNIEILQ